MAEIAHIRINGDTIIITLRNMPYTVGIDHPNFTEIGALLDEEAPDADKLFSLLDKAQAIRDKFSTGGENNIEVRGGQVYYKGQPVHNALTLRIIEFTDKGMPTRPLIRFLDNMMENPSHRAVQELYDFLEKKGMAITTDGHFLAYKGVTEDFKDLHTRTFDNSVGQTVSIERNMVDDDRSNQCSNGLHVGHFQYAKSFAGDGPVVLVKVNPRDAVSVPQDHDCGKLRTCRYEVLKVYVSADEVEENPTEELPGSLYDERGEGVPEECYDDDGEVEIEFLPYDEDDLDESTKEFMDLYDRDELCRFASRNGVFPSTEAARRAGKALVAEACAKAELAGDI